MDGHGGLAVLVGGEVLGARQRDGRVARDDLLDHATHGLQAQRKRGHVQQQPVVLAVAALTDELCGLHGGAQRHHLVGVQTGIGRLAEVAGHGLADDGHAGGTAHQHHAVDGLGRQAGIGHGGVGDLERACHQRLHQFLEARARQGGNERGTAILLAGITLASPGRTMAALARYLNRALASISVEAHCHRVGIGQGLTGLTGHQQQRAPALGMFCRQPGWFAQVVLAGKVGSDQRIEVVTAQSHVTRRGLHLEDAPGQLEHRHVEGAPAQVVDGVGALLAFVQTVGHGGGGRFVDEAQHVQSGQPGRILGGLALGVVEIGGHGDDSTCQRVLVDVKRGQCAIAQHLQDLGRHFHGRDGSGRSGHGHGTIVASSRGICCRIRPRSHHPQWQALCLGVGQPTAHQALDRADDVARVGQQRLLGGVAHHGRSAGTVMHDRRQQLPALLVRQRIGHARAADGHQRVGSSQIDTDGIPALVRIRTHARLGNLQQRHRRCRKKNIG